MMAIVSVIRIDSEALSLPALLESVERLSRTVLPKGYAPKSTLICQMEKYVQVNRRGARNDVRTIVLQCLPPQNKFG